MFYNLCNYSCLTVVIFVLLIFLFHIHLYFYCIVFLLLLLLLLYLKVKGLSSNLTVKILKCKKCQDTEVLMMITCFSQDPCWQRVKKPLHLVECIHVLLSGYVNDPSRVPTYDRYMTATSLCIRFHVILSLTVPLIADGGSRTLVWITSAGIWWSCSP